MQRETTYKNVTNNSRPVVAMTHPEDGAHNDPSQLDQWLPVVRQLEGHPQLEPPRTQKPSQHDRPSLKDRFDGEAIYYHTGGSGAVWVHVSPPQEEQHLLSGTLEYTGGLTGDPLYRPRQEIASVYQTGYLSVTDARDNLATVRIPQEFDKKRVTDTITAGVDILDEIAGLDQLLTETIAEYAISPAEQ